MLLAACAGSTSSTTPPHTASQVFTYDTTATVMNDGWDPATEYSDGIIAMSQMYETLTRYDAATHRVAPLLATSWSAADNGRT
jgi:peptide/nickel transport system substrate-binding protein